MELHITKKMHILLVFRNAKGKITQVYNGKVALKRYKEFFNTLLN